MEDQSTFLDTISTLMEDQSTFLDLPAEEESNETLSLRDLQIGTNSVNSSPGRTFSAHPETFEFFSDAVTISPNTENIIFCGKLIPFNPSENDAGESGIDRVKYLRTLSFHRPDQIFNFIDERDRFSRAKRSEPYQSRSAYSVQKVNITSLTSMSSKARRRMFMFGPVKFKPEMELSAIRERQSRRTPGPMFPAFEGGETVADGGGKGQLKLAVKRRAPLTKVLAKSFCIS